MRANADHDTVDDKIHHFMARKSPLRTLSKMVADRLAVAPMSAGRSDDGMTYEVAEWHQKRSSYPLRKVMLKVKTL
ncbi:MAG: hypothetical protein H6797_00510 [Candidatus Nomurabacteria bacterium]|nr:MAG: hypothetical protein H6797_00510 [Candidatus Nomurabacteria bacterium]